MNDNVAEHDILTKLKSFHLIIFSTILICCTQRTRAIRSVNVFQKIFHSMRWNAMRRAALEPPGQFCASIWAETNSIEPITRRFSGGKSYESFGRPRRCRRSNAIGLRRTLYIRTKASNITNFESIAIPVGRSEANVCVWVCVCVKCDRTNL